jgi:hypothetical protein
MAPLSQFSALLHLLNGQALSPFVTVKTESSVYCRNYPDQFGRAPRGFPNNVQVNATCWTNSSMYLDPRGDPQPNGSFAWLWIDLGTRYPELSGVGNADGGGKATGHGCWLKENDVKNAEGFYFPDVIEWCGHAPHHQVRCPLDYEQLEASSLAPQVVARKNGGKENFLCRNCTDLADPMCKATYDLGPVGYVQTGCWTEGTEVEGNSTWVKLVEPALADCYISPDQFAHDDWHGKLEVLRISVLS